MLWLNMLCTLSLLRISTGWQVSLQAPVQQRLQLMLLLLLLQGLRAELLLLLKLLEIPIAATPQWLLLLSLPQILLSSTQQTPVLPTEAPHSPWFRATPLPSLRHLWHKLQHQRQMRLLVQAVAHQQHQQAGISRSLLPCCPLKPWFHHLLSSAARLTLNASQHTQNQPQQGHQRSLLSRALHLLTQPLASNPKPVFSTCPLKL